MSSGGSGGSTLDDSVKHMFDRIGEKVYDKVKKEAQTYKGELKGDLQEAASTIPERVSNIETCKLVQEYYNHPNGGGVKGERYPCTNLKRNTNEERFSNTLGGQCTNKKIEGNKNNCGACAPYRRLHLCDYNLESIDTTSTTHTLLAEVCMAAKYEGNSIDTPYIIHKQTNEDSASQLCTVLARSFADIGDIVRGKDLFLGYNEIDREQKKKIQDNLRKIFAKIYEGLTTTNGKKSAKEYYKDENGGNFFKLREDWWTANRETVWKALTCDVKSGNNYFRQTCDGSGKTGTLTPSQCRCDDNQVPTYFDYVPQYLRWFEEWAEDFCRKKKHKLKDVKTNCRDYEQNLYCSGNGYDCTKTIYKKGRIVIGSECTKCSVWCRLYEKWIDNQKLEFLKQRKKYETEISGGASSARRRRTRDAGGTSTTNYEGYDRKFYEKFKSTYDDVTKFLGLLNKEATCKDITDEKEKIDFKTVDNSLNKNKNDEGTFYHSQYCKPCPDCGVKRKDGEWEHKKKGNCTREKRYNITSDANRIDINVLSFGDKGEDRETKLNKFCAEKNGGGGGGGSGTGAGGGVAALGVPCTEGGVAGSNSDSLCEPWKCYKHEHVQKVNNGEDDDDDDDVDGNYVKNGGGLCILQNKNKKEKKSENDPEEFQKTFNEFFYFWIGRFLNDSMYWRGKVGGCLKNKSGQCKNVCKKKCDCFLKWIKKKKEEWKKIVEHFNTQNISGTVGNGNDVGLMVWRHDVVLKFVLDIDELFNNIKSGYGNVKETEGINKILDEEKQKRKAAGAAGGGAAALGGICTED
ncbi:hypothetical protein PFTANZ_05809, partial [Plasmodium falciparum Tanzania (2000708)]